MHHHGLAVLAALLCTLGGCASNWQRGFTPEPGALPAAGPADRSQPVELRSVPWERMQSTLQAIEKQNAGSDVSPADWTPEQRLAAKTQLLKGLQINEDPAAVAILGASSFRSTDLLRPEAGSSGGLESFARKIGATRVVWSRSVLGKTDTIVHEPVTNHTSGSFSSAGLRGGRRERFTSYSESSTSWVPVTVQSDEYGYVAFFLR